MESAIAQRPPALSGRPEAPEPPRDLTGPAQAPEPPPSKPDSAWPDESYRGWSGL